MRKVVALLITGIMLLTSFTAFADDDLEARVAALEEKVAALEAQLTGSVPEGVSAAPVQEVADVGEVETGMVANGCSLEYVEYEIGKTYDDQDCVILYFDFINGSGETSYARREFNITVFQHDKEQGYATLSFGTNQADTDVNTELRSGAAPLRVAFTSLIGDTSDIIVRIESNRDYDVEPIEFSLSLE